MKEFDQERIKKNEAPERYYLHAVSTERRGSHRAGVQAVLPRGGNLSRKRGCKTLLQLIGVFKCVGFSYQIPCMQATPTT